MRIREANAEVLGHEVIDKTDEVFGLDEEGEIKGSYRPSGHPGVCVFDDTIVRVLTFPIAVVRYWRLLHLTLHVEGTGTLFSPSFPCYYTHLSTRLSSSKRYSSGFWSMTAVDPA